jgi:hypothetical protein
MPRPGNNPYASSQGMARPGTPRPGNNPFAGSQGMPRHGGGAGPRPMAPRPGAPRPGAPGQRPGAPGRPGAPFQQRPGGPGRRRLRRSSRWWWRSWPRTRRWHRGCLRSRRRQEQGPQVASHEARRIRNAGGPDDRWRERSPR